MTHGSGQWVPPRAGWYSTLDKGSQGRDPQARGPGLTYRLGGRYKGLELSAGVN